MRARCNPSYTQVLNHAFEYPRASQFEPLEHGIILSPDRSCMSVRVYQEDAKLLTKA